MTLPPAADVAYFRQKLLHWHLHDNRRTMPWKGEKDVYKIWLSEIILQQTRVEQGKQYYLKFIQQYPTVQHLAAAPQQEVYKLWEGLGYYNRCKNLHLTAKTIVQQLNGRFPETYEGLLQLKGVGPYTAAAIASFAYNLPHAVLDGNVYRVLSRFFGIYEPTDNGAGQKLFAQLAQLCLHKKTPAYHNQAIMDLGATICKPSSPLCHHCPLHARCKAFAHNTVSDLPVRNKQLRHKQRWFVFFDLNYRHRMAVRKREGKDVWFQLYELPHYEAATAKEWRQFIENELDAWINNHYGRMAGKTSVTQVYKQALTHQQIQAVFVSATLQRPLSHLQQHWEWFTDEELQQLAFPKIIKLFMEQKKGNALAKA